MATPPKLYTRLTRSWIGIGSYNSLWLAEDHLLQVSSNGYTEKYQRFFFRDIKGLLVSQTGTFALTNGIAGSLSLLSGVPLVYSIVVENLSVFALVVFIPSLVVLLTNLVLGSSCRVHILTGIQTEPLRVLTRTRRTRAALAKLEPRIHGAQVGLVPPTIATPAVAPAPEPALGAVAPEVVPTPSPTPADQAPPAATPESPGSP